MTLKVFKMSYEPHITPPSHVQIILETAEGWVLTTEGCAVSSSCAMLPVVGWSYYASELSHERTKQLRLSISHCSSGSVTDEGTNLWLLSPTSSSLIQKVHCGGLKQNGHQRLIDLNTFSPFGGSLGRVRKSSLIGGSVWLGVGFEVLKDSIKLAVTVSCSGLEMWGLSCCSSPDTCFLCSAIMNYYHS